MLQGLGKDTRWKNSLHFLSRSQLSRNCGYVAFGREKFSLEEKGGRGWTGKLYTLVSVYILILRLIGDIDMVVSIRLEYLITTTGYCCIVVIPVELGAWACFYYLPIVLT